MNTNLRETSQSIAALRQKVLPLLVLASATVAIGCAAVQEMMEEQTRQNVLMAERRGPSNSDEQSSFENLQARRSEQYFSAGTSMGKSSLLSDLNRETVVLLTDISPDWRLATWSARLKSVNTNGNTIKIVLSHKSYGGTFETLYISNGYVSQGSGDFSDLEFIEEGKKVSFSGRIVNQATPLKSNGRLTFEDSFTETGRMRQPEFIVDFLEVTFRTAKALR